MTWHVFNYDSYAGRYPSYREAVAATQAMLLVTRRPQRIASGFYDLRGYVRNTPPERAVSHYWIATAAAARQHGFNLAAKIADAEASVAERQPG